MITEQKSLLFQGYRGVAIFAVVFQHVGQYMTSHTENELFSLLKLTTIWCVPLFLFISGYFSKKTFSKKSICKIVVPYVFWSLIYILFGFAVYRALPKQNLLTILAFGQASVQLYFSLTILTLVIFSPIIHRYIEKIDSGIGQWLMFIIVICIWELHNSIVDLYVCGFSAFYIYGVSFRYNKGFITDRGRLFVVFAIIAGLICLIDGTLFSVDILTARNPLCIYLSLLIIYLMFSRTKRKSFPILHKCLAWLGNFSYGIYLVHMLVFEFLWNLYYDLIPNTNNIVVYVVMVFLISAVVIAICTAIIEGLKKIIPPNLCRIIGL